MAQINITLNQDEIMRLLEDSSGEAFKLMLQKSLNTDLRAESAEQIGAGRLRARRQSQRHEAAPPHAARRHDRPHRPEVAQRALQDHGVRQLQAQRGRPCDHHGEDGLGRRFDGEGGQAHGDDL